MELAKRHRLWTAVGAAERHFGSGTAINATIYLLRARRVPRSSNPQLSEPNASGGFTLIIWLSGPTGSGKTSLVSAFSQLGYSVVQEDVPTRLFEAFAADPLTHCEAVQEALMRSRRDQYQLLSDKLKVVFDRSVNEDLSVFCRIHLASGYLNALSFSRLEALAAELEAELPSPDLIIYLTASESVLQQRMDVVGHPKPIVDSLAEQIRLYDEWISCRSEGVVKIDNSNCPPAVLDAILKGRQC